MLLCRSAPVRSACNTGLVTTVALPLTGLAAVYDLARRVVTPSAPEDDPSHHHRRRHRFRKEPLGPPADPLTHPRHRGQGGTGLMAATAAHGGKIIAWGPLHPIRRPAGWELDLPEQDNREACLRTPAAGERPGLARLVPTRRCSYGEVVGYGYRCQRPSLLSRDREFVSLVSYCPRCWINAGQSTVLSVSQHFLCGFFQRPAPATLSVNGPRRPHDKETWPVHGPTAVDSIESVKSFESEGDIRAR